MFKSVGFFDSYTREISSTWWLFLLEGLWLMGLGVLIAVMPSLLVALVSAVFVVLGIMTLATALRVRGLRRRCDDVARRDAPPPVRHSADRPADRRRDQDRERVVRPDVRQCRLRARVDAKRSTRSLRILVAGAA